MLSNISLPVAKLNCFCYCFEDVEEERTAGCLKWCAADPRGKDRPWDVGHDRTGAAAKHFALLKLGSWHIVLSRGPQCSSKLLNVCMGEGKREKC